jgi:plastocyanin
MIWIVRVGFALAILSLVAFALVTYRTQPPAPSNSQADVAEGAAGALSAHGPTVPPALTPVPTPRPTSTPEAVISRMARTTPTPLPRPARPGLGPTDVSIADDGFAPAVLRVKVGQSVVWRNDSLLSHDVTPTRAGATWGSGPILPNNSVAEIFSRPGRYDYICSLHSVMRGQIIVAP